MAQDNCRSANLLHDNKNDFAILTS
jgi:hypothetical protein